MHLPLQGTSPTCALWGSRTVCGPEQLYRGARGAAIARWTREISRPRYGYLSRYAVASTRRVAESSYACGGGRRSRCARRARKYAYFHTQKSEPQPATAHRLPALVGTLSSAKSEELRARAITNLPKSSECTGARGTCAGSLCGRGWVVRCPCFNFKFGTGRRAAPNNSRLQFSERGPRARCERKKRTRWPTPDS